MHTELQDTLTGDRAIDDRAIDDRAIDDRVLEDVVLERLLNQSYLFDDPGAYEAGVRDAFDVLASPLRPELRPEDEERLLEAMKAHPSAGVARRLQAVDGAERDTIPDGLRAGSAA